MVLIAFSIFVHLRPRLFLLERCHFRGLFVARTCDRVRSQAIEWIDGFLFGHFLRRAELSTVAADVRAIIIELADGGFL
jgi:hypothetical protein